MGAFMNWVVFRRLTYLPMLAVAFVSAGVAAFLLRDQPLYLFAIVAILFVPGIVARHFLKDLLASRALMARRDFEGALAAAQRFLEACIARPWLRHTIWAAFGIYTLDAIAMAQNNAGAALLELKRFDESERFLLAARERDPAYPIPVMNLAAIEKIRGDEDRAKAILLDAYRLGMRFNGIDDIHRSIGEAYARLGARA